MTVPSPVPRGRDPWLDNARFALITLVVFGHLLEPLLDGHVWLAAVYRFIYAFHMPAFAFLSGAVTRATLDGRALRSVSFRLLWPYLVFQGLYALAALSPAWPDDGVTSLITPYWLLWYLLSLACWRCMLPLFAHLRYRMAIAVAVAVGAGCFGDIGYSLSLSRTLVFFPLFMLGWGGARAWRAMSGFPHVRVAAAGTLAAIFVVMAWLHPDVRWLYGSYGYTALDSSLLPGMATRLLLLATAAAGTLAFLALVPRRHGPFAAFGARSLGAYVLQGFVIKAAVGGGLFALWAAWPDAALLATLLATAVVLTLALSSAPVARMLNPVTAPRWLEQHLWRSSPAVPRGTGQPNVSVRS